MRIVLADYNYLESFCGSGKTHWACEQMVERPGLHLFAVDRREVMEEREQMLRSLAQEHGTSLVIMQICSSNESIAKPLPQSLSPSVRVQIEALPHSYTNGHVIVIITHEGLKMADLSAFAGWTLWVDETPEIFIHEKVQSPASSAFFEQHYALGQTLGKWAEIDLKPMGDATVIANDQFFTELRSFHRRIGSPHTAVFCDLNGWSDMANKNRIWNHWSLWLAEDLDVFRKVYFLANAFSQSVTYELFRSLSPNIQWQSISLPPRSKFCHRKMTINYFAEAHYGRRNLFKTEKGQGFLRKIADHLVRHVDPKDRIWTCNEADEKLFSEMAVSKLSPKQSGTNRFDDKSTAIMIYSAKPSPDEKTIFDLLGVERDLVIRCREYEAILQFMCRTSVRDPASDRDLNLFVYDRRQADFLKNYFDGSSHIYAALNLIDLGFANYEHSSKAGRKRKPEPTAAEKQARQDQTRAKNRESKRRSREKSKQAALEKGELPKPRGRPRKSPNALLSECSEIIPPLN